MADTCSYEYLYRLLRNDEYPMEDGLVPKDASANVTVQKHIAKGSKIESQFISTSCSLNAILQFAQMPNSQTTRIAVISVADLEESGEAVFYDLTDPVIRNRYLKPKAAKERAKKIQEILIAGTIPNDCIMYEVDMSCKYEYLYRLLRKKENPEDGLIAKDPDADFTVHKFVLDGISIASQFISTSSSKRAVKWFAKKSSNHSKQVAKINVKLLEESGKAVFLDLTLQDNRDQYLETDQAFDAVQNFREVLIIGKVPDDCIEDVFFI